MGKKVPKPTEPSWVECKKCKEQILEVDLAENAHTFARNATIILE